MAGGVVTGIVAEWVTTLNPTAQAIIILGGGAAIVTAAYVTAGRLLHAEDDGADLLPTMTWARDYQPPTGGRETRAARHRLWQEENRHRDADNEDPAKQTVSRIFGDVLAVDLPDLPQRTQATPPPPPASVPAVGKATVPAVLDVPVTDPEQVDLDAVLADFRAWAADPDRTGWIPPVVSWRGYRQ